MHFFFILFFNFFNFFIYFIFFFSDQKAIDLENRASYTALRKRWEVLDMTITFPEEEIGDNSPPYMEASEGECEQDDSNSLPPPLSPYPSPFRLTLPSDHQVSSTSEFTAMCRTCGKARATVSKEKGVVSECDGQEEKCAGCVGNGGVASYQPPGVEEVDGKGLNFEVCCFCDRARGQRFSTSGVVDDDGTVMLQILELPSKVTINARSVWWVGSAGGVWCSVLGWASFLVEWH